MKAAYKNSVLELTEILGHVSFKVNNEDNIQSKIILRNIPARTIFKKMFIALYIWYLLHVRQPWELIVAAEIKKQICFFSQKLWAPFKNIQSLGHA